MGAVGSPRSRSNRTFMELKLKCPFGATSLQARSNRTFMELKYGRPGNQKLPARSSNRTFMELKLTFEPRPARFGAF